MADDLRKNLGRSQVENHMREEEERARFSEEESQRTRENFRHWNAALEAFANGWKRPVPRFPIVISADSPISTPEKLKEIAGLDTTPEVIETTWTDLDGGPDPNHLDENGNPEKVTVCLVGQKQLFAIHDTTDFEHWLFVWLEGKVRSATLVTSLTKSDKTED